MANIDVNVIDGNNINLVVSPSASSTLVVESGFGAGVAMELYPAPTQVINIDRGVPGNGIASVSVVDVDGSQYLRITFTNGTTSDVGPIATSTYFGVSPIVVTGDQISLSTVPVLLGGTGATAAPDARTNLGLGTIATQNASSVAITGGSISGITDLAVADGGTGASTAEGARTNLGLGSAAVLNAGVANGVATLDAGGTVPLSQIPASIQGGVSYQGTWNATTNTPTLTSSVGTKGYYYVVSVAGSTSLNGITSWNIGDWAIFNGTAWEKIDNTDAVTSVNGLTGTVVLTTTDISEGTNQYFTDSLARAAISAGTGISYNNTTGVVTNAAPDQTVVLTGSGTTTVTGTYPNFTISSADSNVGTVTSVGITAGTGVTVSGSPITTSGNISVGLSAKLTDIENLSGAGFITQNGSGNIARRTIQAGTGISVAHGNGSSQDPIITNSAPDQTVVLTAGTGISTSGTYPNFTITNAAPDQTVALTGSGTTTVTGTYPNFTINSDDQYDGTVTSVGGTGTVNGISLSGTVTSSGNLTLGGSLSGVDLTTQVTGTLPIANGGTGQTTRQAAMDALAGSTTSGQYLRGDGTDVVMSAIQAGDVPTLNQNTTGTSSNVTGTVAVANGGTGATTLTANNVVLGNGTSAVQFVAPGTTGNVLTSNGTTWTSATLSAGGLPAGSVIFFAANAAPTGYLKANGATVSRTTYAALFSAIGTTFGAGDGSTTFVLPELRGEFIRGWADGRAVDTGRVFGSFQTDDFKSHNHTYNASAGGASTPASINVASGQTLNTSSTGGTETRPRNIALLACIKF
jgi:microcystin-dependent protein